MAVSAELVKTLRERSGVGIMDCKDALEETKGDIESAIDYLRKKGLSKAVKKADRATSEGLVASYIHAGGKIGVLVEVNCETDFVAKTEGFRALGNDIAMHIAASRPLYVSRTDVPDEMLGKEKEIYKEQLLAEGKPDAMLEKIVEGKLNKFYTDVCLLEQAFIKDEDKTIEQLLVSKT